MLEKIIGRDVKSLVLDMSFVTLLATNANADAIIVGKKYNYGSLLSRAYHFLFSKTQFDGVIDYMMYRSNGAFLENFRCYVAALKDGNWKRAICIIRVRNKNVSKLWPEAFDYLRNKQNWTPDIINHAMAASCFALLDKHSQQACENARNFFGALERLGAEQMRKCPLRINYDHQIGGIIEEWDGYTEDCLKYHVKPHGQQIVDMRLLQRAKKFAERHPGFFQDE